MKLGDEVEGMHKGMKTVFADSHEIDKLAAWLESKPIDKLDQIYISDLENVLDLHHVPPALMPYAPFFKVITIERTRIPENTVIHKKLSIMLNIENSSFWKLCHLDQVKFSKNLTVCAFPIRDTIKTLPEDFAKDIEL